MSRRMIVLLLAGMLLCSQAHAVLFSFVGDGTFDPEGSLQAQAKFMADPGSQDLEVWLANTGPDVMVPSQVLTALFFDIRDWNQYGPTIDQPLTPESASLLSDLDPPAPNPAVARFVPYDKNGHLVAGYLDPNVAPDQYNIGGEWAYGYFPGATSEAPGGTTQGISSSGLGLFGAGNLNGPNLAPPRNGAVDGVQYGLLSINDNPSTGNNAVTGRENNPQPLVWYHATFQVDLPGQVVWGDHWTIQNVWFQYGTATSEPEIGPLYVPGYTVPPPGVPEPASLCLLGLAGGAIATVVKKRKKAA